MNEYQKSYYEKHKEKLKQKARERRAQKKEDPSHLSLVRVQDVQESQPQSPPQKIETHKGVPSIQENSHPESCVSSIERIERKDGVQFSNIERLKLFGLIGLGSMITVLLLHQMIQFYVDDPWPLRVAKAVSMEGLILFFSTLKHSKLICTVIYRLIALAMCLLSLYTMSAKQIEVHELNVQKHEMAFKRVQETELALKQNQTLQDEYLKGSWLTAARKNSDTLNALNHELESSRVEWIQTASQYHTLIVQLATRMFFMLGNILIAQTLLKGVRQNTVHRSSLEKCGSSS